MDNSDFEYGGALRHRRRQEEEPEDRFKMLRQVLNILFMLGAVAGVAIYFTSNQTTGTYIILGSMVFKIVECVLRLTK